jgi:hypothetical protein
MQTKMGHLPLVDAGSFLLQQQGTTNVPAVLQASASELLHHMMLRIWRSRLCSRCSSVLAKERKQHFDGNHYHIVQRESRFMFADTTELVWYLKLPTSPLGL